MGHSLYTGIQTLGQDKVHVINTHNSPVSLLTYCHRQTAKQRGLLMRDCKGLGKMWMYPKGRTYLGNRQQRKTSHDSGRSRRFKRGITATRMHRLGALPNCSILHCRLHSVYNSHINFKCFTSMLPLHLYRVPCHDFFFAVALRPNAGHGLLMPDVSRSHTTTHHSQ
jgi:hypothetical protein